MQQFRDKSSVTYVDNQSNHFYERTDAASLRFLPGSIVFTVDELVTLQLITSKTNKLLMISMIVHSLF